MSDNSKDSLNDSTNINDVSNQTDETTNEEATVSSLEASSDNIPSDVLSSEASESATHPEVPLSNASMTKDEDTSSVHDNSVSDETTSSDESDPVVTDETQSNGETDQSLPNVIESNDESTVALANELNASTDNRDVLTPDKSNDSPIKSLLSKPNSVIKPLIPPVNQITGALKRSIDWDAVPDNKASSNESDDPENIPFNTSEAEEKPPTISRRIQPRVVENFVSFSNKSKTEEPEKDPDTAVLSENSPSWKKVIDGQATGTTATIGEQREVLFVIRGMIERVVMQDNGIVTLGRFDTGTVPNAEIDLIPYGALDRGVSRRHCKIQLRDSQLYVTDLQSTNGTFLAGVRLKPQEPTILRKGDEVLLGRLAVQILFR